MQTEEKQQKEITIAFGNQIALTKDRKTQKEIFIKIAPAFRKEQLKELKGAPLSVFICYGLHSDGESYTWVDDRIIKKETGYVVTTKIRQKLIKKGYLFQARLRNKQGRLRDYIYRLFQPIESGKKFIIRGEELYAPVEEKTYLGKKPEQEKSGGIIEEKPINLKEETKNMSAKPTGWDLKEEIKKMKEDKRRHIQIIGLWIEEKELQPNNAKQLLAIIKRNCRAAITLTGYSDKAIQETIQVVKNTDYLKKWTLETITKFIDEVISQIKKRGPRIIRYEHIKRGDGTMVARPIYAPKEDYSNL